MLLLQDFNSYDMLIREALRNDEEYNAETEKRIETSEVR